MSNTEQQNSKIIRKSSFNFQQPIEIQTNITDKYQKQSSQNYLDQLNTINFGKNQYNKNQSNLLDLDQQQSSQHNQLIKKGQYLNFIENRIIQIEGPQLINQGLMTSYKLYKIKSKKNNEGNQGWDTCVSRRFSDFQYLQKKLIQKYGGYIIPLLPQKNFWASINMQGKQYIQLRTKNLLKYLQRLINHQKLKKTDEVKNFLFNNDNKFSQGKGQYFSQVKTQDKVRNLASNALQYGKDIFSRFYQKKQIVAIINPTKQDLTLTEYEILVNQLIRVTGILRIIVENTARQINSIYSINQTFQSNSHRQENIRLKQCSNSLLNQFQDLCKFIQSCSDALSRRKEVRLELDSLKKQQENIGKKLKSNPRSYQIDLLRSKITKSSQQCQSWTVSLIQQLSKSVYLGRSMLQDFIHHYQKVKTTCYDTQF